MRIVPEFMRRFDAFHADRRAVRTAADWRALRDKWLDAAQWPRKTNEQQTMEARGKQGPIELGGRWWAYTTWIYDVSPEARYEYFLTTATVGDPLQFPRGPGEPPTAPRSGWTQECRYCEISTAEIGETTCPRCGRPLLCIQSAD